LAALIEGLRQCGCPSCVRGFFMSPATPPRHQRPAEESSRDD
jgi:hypothetical protein